MDTKQYFAEKWAEQDLILLDLAQQAFRFFMTDEVGQSLLSQLGIHVATCVIDTNILLKDISRTLKKKEVSALILAARIGTLRIYASTQVRDEVPEKLYSRAQSFGIDPVEACQLWKTTYVPLVHFIDPAELARDGEKIAALLQRDPDDVPTAQLIEILRPAVVFSEDQDLADFGPTRVPWTQLACAYRDQGERDAHLVTLSIGGGFALQVSFGALRLLGTLLTRINRQWLFIAAIALSISLVIPPTRRAMVAGVRTLTNRLQEMDLGELFLGLVDGLRTMEDEVKEARAFLEQQERSIASPEKAFEYLVQVLSLSGTALSPMEMSQRMVARGYRPRGDHPERYVSHLLRSHPQLFTRQENGRWQMVSLVDREQASQNE